ncbi:MAG: HAD-IIA family hydrolase [Provencibacterium sp.]|jgi:4-nitrophenyl phosphatase|nr:HAD-IIA family hydrolase [Provencibacterium sp.]
MTDREKAEKLKKIKCFVLDMDGTIYLGDRLFDFTPEFLKTVEQCQKTYCFFTNNSSKNEQAYLQKLARMGIHIPRERMLISNGVIIDWLLKNRPGESAYLVGTPLLEEAFRQGGIPLGGEEADYVVLGFDTTLAYQKLVIACNMVRAGKTIYGVNPDFNCPVENGFIPDCGSMAALIKASTGVQCEFFGKPSRETLRYLIKHTGCREEELAVVGDRLYTDIAVADKTAVTSILVLSGETKLQDLAGSSLSPDMVCQSLEELTRLLKMQRDAL